MHADAIYYHQADRWKHRHLILYIYIMYTYFTYRDTLHFFGTSRNPYAIWYGFKWQKLFAWCLLHLDSRRQATNSLALLHCDLWGTSIQLQCTDTMCCKKQPCCSGGFDFLWCSGHWLFPLPPCDISMTCMTSTFTCSRLRPGCFRLLWATFEERAGQHSHFEPR